MLRERWRWLLLQRWWWLPLPWQGWVHSCGARSECGAGGGRGGQEVTQSTWLRQRLRWARHNCDGRSCRAHVVLLGKVLQRWPRNWGWSRRCRWVHSCKGCAYQHCCWSRGWWQEHGQVACRRCHGSSDCGRLHWWRLWQHSRHGACMLWRRYQGEQLWWQRLRCRRRSLRRRCGRSCRVQHRGKACDRCRQGGGCGP